jgi:AraC-like DNA-binding protein
MDNIGFVTEQTYMPENERLLLETSLLQKTLRDPVNEKLTVKGRNVYIIGSDAMKSWKFLYLPPKNTEWVSVLLYAFLLFAALSLIGMVLAFLNTKKIYRPIENAVNILMDDEKYAIQDELAYISETAVSVKRANKELNQLVKDKNEILRGKFLSDLVFGLIPHVKVEKSIREYNLEYLLNPLTAAVLEAPSIYRVEKEFTKEEFFNIRLTVTDIIRQGLKIAGIAEVFELEYFRYVVIAVSTDMALIKKSLTDILAKIETAYGIAMIAAIGKPAGSIYEIGGSFIDALNILEYKWPMDRTAIKTYNDLDNLKNSFYYYPLDIEKSLIAHVIDGEKEKVELMLHNLVHRNVHEKTIDKESLSEFNFSIVCTVKRILQQTNMTSNDVFGEGFILYLELSTCHKEQLGGKITDIFNTLIAKINDGNDVLGYRLVDKIVTFIRENYYKDISLDDIAARFNLSAGYVGKLLKQTLNINFKDYLNNYRVEKAKEILRADKNIKINKLSEMVGCNNPATFIRMFKRYEGLSPGEFSKSL